MRSTGLDNYHLTAVEAEVLKRLTVLSSTDYNVMTHQQLVDTNEESVSLCTLISLGFEGGSEEGSGGGSRERLSGELQSTAATRQLRRERARQQQFPCVVSTPSTTPGSPAAKLPH